MAFNILLVDDSVTTRKVMAKTFRLASIPINELYEASNGTEALELLKNRWIDVVFADINMPVMDGEELVNRMSQDGLLKTTPVVLVSIEGSATRIEQLKAKGVSAFIRKPFTPETLQAVLDSVMSPHARPGQREQLSRIFSQVLEQFAFMFSDAAARDDIVPAGDAFLQAKMTFTGAISGSLSLTVPATLGPQIAANVLGADREDQVAPSDGEDAIKELLNMTCGQLLTAIAGEKPVFELTVPAISRLGSNDWQNLLNSDNSLLFIVEDSPVLVSLIVEAPGS